MEENTDRAKVLANRVFAAVDELNRVRRAAQEAGLQVSFFISNVTTQNDFLTADVSLPFLPEKK